MLPIHAGSLAMNVLGAATWSRTVSVRAGTSSTACIPRFLSLHTAGHVYTCDLIQSGFGLGHVERDNPLRKPCGYHMLAIHAVSLAMNVCSAAIWSRTISVRAGTSFLFAVVAYGQGTFWEATSFNQSLDAWDTSSVTSLYVSHAPAPCWPSMLVVLP